MTAAACSHPSSSRQTVHEALLGAAASSAACIVSNPVDTVRVRMQLQQGKDGLPNGPLRAMRVVAEREGLLALWRSMPQAVAYNAVLNSVRFSLYSAITAGTLYTTDGLSPPVGGFIAGTVAGAVASPFAKARTAAQREAVLARDRIHPLKLPASVSWGASSSWALRNGGHTGIIFSCYENFKCQLAVTLPLLSETTHSLLASLAASSLSCVVVNPLDVVATRLFVQPTTRPAISVSSLTHNCANAAVASPVYSSPLDVVVKIVLAEGIPGLYKGLAANIARIVPHTCLTFAIVEVLRSRIGNR
mmetsp:Transcript_29160/g.89330  ORF Transcript_29160/g.89330 Transcript_29160/m.89330 type:complete len:304 (-) Transcript_29160:212-1123(-)